jgi:hypothetical protein
LPFSSPHITKVIIEVSLLVGTDEDTFIIYYLSPKVRVPFPEGMFKEFPFPIQVNRVLKSPVWSADV